MEKIYAQVGNEKFAIPDEEAALIIATQEEYEAGAMGRAIAKKHIEIDQMRDRMIARGVAYIFPGDVVGTIQLRSEVDIRNVTSRVTKALMLAMANDTVTAMPFRDQEDETHMLTGPEIVAMGNAVENWIEGHYIAAWGHKENLKDVEGEAVKTIADIEDYDISAGWPE